MCVCVWGTLLILIVRIRKWLDILDKGTEKKLFFSCKKVTYTKILHTFNKDDRLNVGDSMTFDIKDCWAQLYDIVAHFVMKGSWGQIYYYWVIAYRT